MRHHPDRRRGASGDDSQRSASPIFIRVRPATEPVLLGLKPGLKAERFRLHAGSHPLEGISRCLKAEELFLEPGEPGLEGEELFLQPGEFGLEGEEQVLKAEEHFLEPGQLGLEGEEQLLKGEEFFFEQPEPGLQEM